MKRLPWVCWAKFIFRDCAGGEAFIKAGERGLDRSKRDFLCCCTTCWIFFFLFSSIKKMASPRFASLLTLLCLTLNNGNFRIHTFLKIRSHNFTGNWIEGRVESRDYLQSVLVRLILNWECGESGSVSFPQGSMSGSKAWLWPWTDKVVLISHGFVGLDTGVMAWQREENNLAFLPLLFNVWQMLRK